MLEVEVDEGGGQLGPEGSGQIHLVSLQHVVDVPGRPLGHGPKIIVTFRGEDNILKDIFIYKRIHFYLPVNCRIGKRFSYIFFRPSANRVKKNT